MRKDKQNNQYFSIPKKLVLEEKYKRLSSDAKLVYSYITTENENATLEGISEFLGMSKTEVKKALGDIECVSKW